PKATPICGFRQIEVHTSIAVFTCKLQYNNDNSSKPGLRKTRLRVSTFVAFSRGLSYTPACSLFVPPRFPNWRGDAMQRKAIFDTVRQMLGRGFRHDEVAALDGAIDLALGGDAAGDPPQHRAIGAEGTALIKRFEG